MPRPNRIEPGPDQESVWDYPRPPCLEPSKHRVRVVHAGAVVANSTRAWRMLETSQAPAFYVPVEDVSTELLRPAEGGTWCEWKGHASYWDVVVDQAVSSRAAWSYPEPASPYEQLRDHFAFYPRKLDECWVDDELVEANGGDFYGGWITSAVVGPFKGDAGSLGW